MIKTERSFINRHKSLPLISLLIIFVFFTSCTSIGKLPSGEGLERIENSPNYIDGSFRNPGDKPRPKKRSINIFSAFKKHFLEKRERSRPSSVLPSKKTDLKSFPPDKDVLVWLGHSSYFLQIDGKKILVDPVLSGKAMVLSSYKGSDVYTYDDIPEIDYLIITHDHWDHLEYWGYSPDKVIEHDWDDPIIRLSAESRKRGMPLIHPMIGEMVDLNSPGQFSRWWETVDRKEAREVSKNE